MNIFYLDRDPEPCAEAHCDRHSVKMPVEYAQFDDEFGLVDIVCIEDCESIIKELKDIYDQQVRLELGLSLEE